MRSPRIKEAGSGLYHVISRIVDRRKVLTDPEKSRFLGIMRSVEGFTGCEVLSYAIMGNHFHILLHVPEQGELTNEMMLSRMACLYDARAVQAARALLAEGDVPAAEVFRASCRARMNDLSEFAKALKQRFSQQFNKAHGRKGTLWEERFKSVLLEDCPHTLLTVAAYIELNPLRAGLVEDPKDYRFSSYGEAMGGGTFARQAICRITGVRNWSEAAAEYRKLLYQAGAPDYKKPGRINFTKEQVAQVEQAQGFLPTSVLLHCRVRYFADGVVIGSRAFVDEAFQRHREHFSPKRKDGARAMRGDWDELYCARKLRKQIFCISAQ